MSKKTTKQDTKQQRPKGPVCCKNCLHATLIQYGSNPVLALCSQKPAYNKYGFDVDIANALRTCSMHVKDLSDKDITPLSHGAAYRVTSKEKEVA